MPSAPHFKCVGVGWTREPAHLRGSELDTHWILIQRISELGLRTVGGGFTVLYTQWNVLLIIRIAQAFLFTHRGATWLLTWGRFKQICRTTYCHFSLCSDELLWDCGGIPNPPMHTPQPTRKCMKYRKCERWSLTGFQWNTDSCVYWDTLISWSYTYWEPNLYFWPLLIHTTSSFTAHPAFFSKEIIFLIGSYLHHTCYETTSHQLHIGFISGFSLQVGNSYVGNDALPV